MKKTSLMLMALVVIVALSLSFVAAASESECGNGVLEYDEECEDRDYDNHDACKDDCTINICGDGYIREGIEECDSGSENGYCPSICNSLCKINYGCSNQELKFSSDGQNEINNYAPIGYFDVANCDIIGGWAIDMDSKSEPVTVEIFANGPEGIGVKIASLKTNTQREDVNQAIGVVGVHGFTISTPLSLKDGQSHQIWVYAKDQQTRQNKLFSNYQQLDTSSCKISVADPGPSDPIPVPTPDPFDPIPQPDPNPPISDPQPIPNPNPIPDPQPNPDPDNTPNIPKTDPAPNPLVPLPGQISKTPTGPLYSNVAVSHLGYHPDSVKEVIVYTSEQAGSFEIKNAHDNQVVATYNLKKAIDYKGNPVNCQGGVSCITGEFTDFKIEGNYYISALSENSPIFQIKDSVYSNAASVLLEFYDAQLSQGSSYHADLHRGYNPPFTMMSDGAINMETDQAAVTLIRLASAYRRNPQLFNLDKYNYGTSGKSDLVEHIRIYSKYLEGLQDSTGTFGFAMGWSYTFGCWPDIDLKTPKWIGEVDPCMFFQSAPSKHYTVMGLAALLESVPAINNQFPEDAKEIVQRSIKTYSFAKDTYTFSLDEDSAFFGTSAFLLFDYTGNKTYLFDAYSMRDKVSKNLYSGGTSGQEFYWEEYARHKEDITSTGLQYPYQSKIAEDFFREKMDIDYKYRYQNSIGENAERVFVMDPNIQFQNSRFILTEGLIGAKSLEMTSDPISKIIADSQLAWITGKNKVHITRKEESGSLSFIFGIGNFPSAMHSRLINSTSFSVVFNNGFEYIPGWINGAFIPHGQDGVLYYTDSKRAWEFTETTNEIVATAVELISYLDANYNGREAIKPQIIIDQRSLDTPIAIAVPCLMPVCAMPAQGCRYEANGVGSVDSNGCPLYPCGKIVCDTKGQPGCHTSVATIDPVCIQGSKVIDSLNTDGCRTIKCSLDERSVSIKVCNKPGDYNPK